MNLIQMQRFRNARAIVLRDSKTGHYLHSHMASPPVDFDLIIELAVDVAPTEGA